MEAEYVNGRERINSQTCNLLKGNADDMSTVVSEQAAKRWAEAKHLPMRAGEMAISAPPRAGRSRAETLAHTPQNPRRAPPAQGRDGTGNRGGSVRLHYTPSRPGLQKTGTRY